MMSTLQQELQGLQHLRGMGPGTVEAFGAAFPHSAAALCADSYHYTIRRDGSGLELEIDVYCALVLPASAEDFDEAAWLDQHRLFMTERSDKQSFRVLHRVARALLAGLPVQLQDGQTFALEVH